MSGQIEQAGRELAAEHGRATNEQLAAAARLMRPLAVPAPAAGMSGIIALPDPWERLDDPANPGNGDSRKGRRTARAASQ